MSNFKLDNEPKIKPGFSIPENYFSAFSEKVNQQLPVQKPKIISLWSKNKRWLYATAAIVVLSMSIPVMNYFQTDTKDQYAVEVENYLTHHSTLSDDDIIELLSEEDVDDLKINSNIESSELEEILSDNTNLEEYITN